jgi:NitT/TauT family transport system substrate-binding protein
MGTRRFGIVAAVAALVCAVSACSSSGGSDGGGGGGSSDLGTITLGLGTSPPDLTANQFYYGVKNGFYKKLGLNVVIKPLADDQTAVRALQSGDVDVIWTGALAGMSAMAAGASMKVISATAPKLGFQLVGITSIKRPKDLEGHKLGISAPGAVSAVTPVIMLENDGGDQGKVQVLPIGGSGARAEALVAHKIDAAVLNQPYVSQLSKYSYLHVIAKAADSIPDYIYSFEMSTNKTIKDRADALQAFVKGSVEADKWAVANPDDAVTMSHEVLPDSPAADIKLAITDMAAASYWSSTGEVGQKQWEFTTNSLMDNKLLSKDMSYSDYVDTSFTSGG